MTVSPAIDLSTRIGPARDQGRRPTCLAFAASDAHAALRAAWQALSCEFAFYHAQRRGGRSPHEGATLSDMLSALKEDGQPAEAGWPYLPAVPSDIATWVPPPSATPVFRRNGRECTGALDEVITELVQSRPVILLMKLSAAFYKVKADGVVDEPPGEAPNPISDTQ
jgi:hypothetical protein